MAVIIAHDNREARWKGITRLAIFPAFGRRPNYGSGGRALRLSRPNGPSRTLTGTLRILMARSAHNGATASGSGKLFLRARDAFIVNERGFAKLLQV